MSRVGSAEVIYTKQAHQKLMYGAKWHFITLQWSRKSVDFGFTKNKA